MEGYNHWLVDVRGLAVATLKKNGHEARTFLSWLDPERANRRALRRLSVSDVDAYLSWRLPPLRRGGLHGVCSGLRSLLQYLHRAGLIGRDLAGEVKGPISYHNDEIPRAFTQEQIAALLSVTAGDRTPKGRRDYAMFLLLATYGLRAGEIVRLRLDDMDWRADRVRILHSKTGVESFLPLLANVGNALLEYIQKGRPQTPHRDVFLRVRAPMRPFKSATSLAGVIATRMRQAGFVAEGRHGAHAFRFARAQTLLQASVPRKSISDLLGHLRTSSTEVYLRLAVTDLRAISLDIPGGRVNANAVQ